MSAVAPTVPPLRIVAGSLCSSLGYTLPRNAAAIRARLNLFQETRFVGLGGKPVVGAPVDGLDVWGGQRQAMLMRQAFDEACERARAIEPLFTPEATALLLLLPPPQGGIPLVELHEAFQALLRQVSLHADSRAMHSGRGGLAASIQWAAQWLATTPRGSDTASSNEKPRFVVALASDSLLTAPTIDRLLAQRRLAEDRHTDALIPGEAAAAVVLTNTVGPVTESPEVWITGAAHGRDEWRLDGDEPMRAHALTAVLRDAARQSGIAVADADFHASGMNGEQWMAREIELALSRSMERKREQFPHHRIAQFIGDTGVAGAVATLAWTAYEMGRLTEGATGRPAGRAGLLHFSEDDGQRSAVMLRARSSSSTD